MAAEWFSAGIRIKILGKSRDEVRSIAEVR
jgi:hypothetical protein